MSNSIYGMKGNGHNKATLKAFALLNQLQLASSIQPMNSYVANTTVAVDHQNDVEFVDVQGSASDKGIDNPHLDEIFAIDDQAHYSELGFNFTAFNHFIDIRKGPGIFDDFDGYSYKRGSGSQDEYQTVKLSIEEGVNYWFNDEYVHVLGREWYNSCSPAMERYSFYNDKAIYNSVEEELKARFPLAHSEGKKDEGIPYSVFMPADNMARYWYNQFLQTKDINSLGFILHAIQDASIPHHAAGSMGNWHSAYEFQIDSNLDKWLNDPSFDEDIIALFNLWNSDDPNPPQSLQVSDYYKVPKKNWRIDFLVTWMALNAYHDYVEVYQNFQNGYHFNESSAKELTKKSIALSMIILNDLSIYIEYN